MREIGNTPKQFLLRLLLTLVLFYTNFSIFIPKLFLKKKVLSYILVSILFVISINFLMQIFITGPPFDHINNQIKQGIASNHPKSLKYIIPFIFTMSVYLLGGIFKIVLTYFQKENDTKMLENQQKEMQIQFLRTQLNPHFLFNSLNSIYALVQSKSDKAPEAVITLSKLMRYMLYEVQVEKVPLEKDLEYIENYISLQRLRLNRGSKVLLEIRGNASNLYIQPLLLISFVENAFKYGIDYQGNTSIEITIKMEENTLYFYIKNSIGLQKNNPENSGIGLENVKNQLKYLYNNKYKLDISRQGGFFIVDLTLKLK